MDKNEGKNSIGVFKSKVYDSSIFHSQRKLLFQQHRVADIFLPEGCNYNSQHN